MNNHVQNYYSSYWLHRFLPLENIVFDREDYLAQIIKIIVTIMNVRHGAKHRKLVSKKEEASEAIIN